MKANLGMRTGRQTPERCMLLYIPEKIHGVFQLHKTLTI
jgi:hypothetical protein